MIDTVVKRLKGDALCLLLGYSYQLLVTETPSDQKFLMFRVMQTFCFRFAEALIFPSKHALFGSSPNYLPERKNIPIRFSWS